MNNNSKKLVTIFTTSHRHQIHIIKVLLAEKNIECFVVDENLDTIIGTTIIEGYKLKVDTLDFLRANQIVEKFKASEK